MAQEIPETTYEPEGEEDARRRRERRIVQEGTALWRRRKEELQRQKHREQREVCVADIGALATAVYATRSSRRPSLLNAPVFAAVATDRNEAQLYAFDML